MNHNVKNNTVFAGGIAGSTAQYSIITLKNITISGTIDATHNSANTGLLAGLIGKYYTYNNNSSINDTNNTYDSLLIIDNGTQISPVNAYN